MKVLLIKVSSMGDVIHALPAITDFRNIFPQAELDWVIEEHFVPIAQWHPGVNRVIPVGLRRWRKKGLLSAWKEDYQEFRSQLYTRYDYVIDAQGLLKSAWLATRARGKRCGYSYFSAREPLASFFYQRRFRVSQEQHAIARIRDLFAEALGYDKPDSKPDFGLDKNSFLCKSKTPYIVLCHGTTWESKHWPESYWSDLVGLLVRAGLTVKIAWNGVLQHERALRMAQNLSRVTVLPELDLEEMAQVIAGAQGVVAVDTGFAHLAQAFDVPLVVLYGPTSPGLTGPIGSRQVALSVNFSCAPCFKRECYYKGTSVVQPACFATLKPEQVYRTLLNTISLNRP